MSSIQPSLTPSASSMPDSTKKLNDQKSPKSADTSKLAQSALHTFAVSAQDAQVQKKMKFAPLPPPPPPPSPPSPQPTVSSSSSSSSGASKTLVAEVASKTSNAEEVPTLVSLVTAYENCWCPQLGDYRKEKVMELNEPRVVTTLTKHDKMFPCMVDYTKNFGFIEKLDVHPDTNIYVRADLHGDLKSLIENLKVLQRRGLMDENFRCLNGLKLVFLGDYVDRGNYCIQILELLALLRMENPRQVFLIRGNHEYLYMNQQLAAPGPFRTFVSGKNVKILEKFYETMCLALYVGTKPAIGQEVTAKQATESLGKQAKESQAGTAEKREYALFTHGLFEITTDPAALLDSDAMHAFMPIPLERSLSPRILNILPAASRSLDSWSDLEKSAVRIAKLYIEEANVWAAYPTAKKSSGYNWGDVLEKSEFWLKNRNALVWNLTTEDIYHYLSLSSTLHNVEIIFRGHQHKYQQHKYKGRIIVTSMPVGMDSTPYASQFKGQTDRAYILKSAKKMEDWTKVGMFREPKSSVSQTGSNETASFPTGGRGANETRSSDNGCSNASLGNPKKRKISIYSETV